MDLNNLAIATAQWGRDRNIIGEGTAKQQCLKLMSEVGELADALGKGDAPGIIDGIGDAIVVLIMMAEQEGFTITDALAHAYNEIKDRKGVLFNGVFIKSTDPRHDGAVAELAAYKHRDHGHYQGLDNPGSAVPVPLSKLFEQDEAAALAGYRGREFTLRGVDEAAEIPAPEASV